MADRETIARLSRRITKAGGKASIAEVTNLAAYVELLARWNKKINLTALPVEPLSDEAADRLIVEPVLGARRLLPTEKVVIDVGTGGGSPAIPFAIMAPDVRLIMVEVKVRKSAFLREVVRQLSLKDATVENCRVEELLSKTEYHEAVDVVTVRAVRPDRRLLMAIQAFLKPGGRLFWFGAETSQKPEFQLPFASGQSEMLVPTMGSQLWILTKTHKLL
ncbi:MAG TPA: 16S rRNA (guanine(527)-N(7))-methyltransferase RsmG [Vicinamibacterales bacterium]|nr:16S rRNA (guanine(527)-N(7))-methyltransferase RsmG [Vicinamibacterales bacterium]